MARVKNSENLSAVTGSVTPELREALENYRWDPKVRKTMSEAVRAAIEFWAEAQGIWTPEGAHTDVDETSDDKSDDKSDETSDETSDAESDAVEGDRDHARNEANAAEMLERAEAADKAVEADAKKTTSRSRK